MRTPTAVDGPDRRRLLKGIAGVASLVALPGGTSISRAAVSGSAERDADLGRYGPWVYWYWLDANVTRDGIEADLGAMHAAGIVGVYLFNINGLSDSTVVGRPVESQSETWWELLRFSVERADRLGMTVAMNICDGWGTAGGAWITPAQSARELVWSETRIVGHGGSTSVPQPPNRLDSYEDIAAYAFEVPPDWDVTSASSAALTPAARMSIASSTRVATVTSSWAIDDVKRVADAAQENAVVDTDSAGWLQFSFDAPFMLRSLTLRTRATVILPFLSVGYNGAANSLEVQSSDDGVVFKTIHTLVPPRLGWQSNLTVLTHAIPPTRARHFRFVYEPTSLVVAEGDGQYPVTRHLTLASITLASRPVVDQLPVKSGATWGIGRPMTSALIPNAECISRRAIVDVSAQLAGDSTLHWTPPHAGHWAIFRIGSTSNGKSTDPSGRMGGLECDKFDPAVVTLQFDRWFGEALRRVGPHLAGRVLKVFHIDSWESRSQNWSPQFASSFRSLRGYDLGPLLLVLAGVPVDSADRTERLLFDVRRTIADLLRNNFFGTLERLAHEHDCLFSAQQTNAVFPSDGMQHFRHVDLPSGEFWKGRPASDKPSDVREAVSAARLYGKPIVPAEAFTGGLDWSEHPQSFKVQGDQQFCIGVNRFVLHVWAHQAFPDRKPGITLFGLGSFFSESQPWWPMAGAWIDYLARCQRLLQQGDAVVDFVYYTGEDIPARAYLPSVLQPGLPAGYAYDSINADALATLARVRDGRLVFPGGASYAILILPPHMSITRRMAATLESLVRDGAVICGPRPRASPSLQDTDEDIVAASAILDRLWADNSVPHVTDRAGAVYAANELATAVARTGISPDIDVGGRPIAWTHRRTADRDLYFLSNQGESELDIGIGFRAQGRLPHLYDPVTDRTERPVTMVGPGGRVDVRLSLQAGGSIFVMFDDVPDASRVPLVPVHDTLTLPRPVDVHGPWRVSFELPMGARMVELDHLLSWTELVDPDIRFHSGTARYTTTFAIKRPGPFAWEIDLGAFANVARVMLNGQDLGVLWLQGGRLDVTPAVHSGPNRLEVVIANTWRNRLVGDRDRKDGEPMTWILQNHLGKLSAMGLPKDVPLLPAGLLGPVRLIAVARRH